MTGIPDLLTAEEAAEHLRIGRTKAYAMAKEYRDSGGRRGCRWWTSAMCCACGAARSSS